MTSSRLSYSCCNIFMQSSVHGWSALRFPHRASLLNRTCVQAPLKIRAMAGYHMLRMHIPAVPLRELRENPLVSVLRQKPLDGRFGLPVLLHGEQIDGVLRKIKAPEDVILATLGVDRHVVDPTRSIAVRQQ